MLMCSINTHVLQPGAISADSAICNYLVESGDPRRDVPVCSIAEYSRVSHSEARALDCMSMMLFYDALDDALRDALSQAKDEVEMQVRRTPVRVQCCQVTPGLMQPVTRVMGVKCPATPVISTAATAAWL